MTPAMMNCIQPSSVAEQALVQRDDARPHVAIGVGIGGLEPAEDGLDLAARGVHR